MLDKAQASPDMKMTILQSLLMNGFIDFDKVSKTRTIEDILVGLNASSTTQMCEIYSAIILQPGVDDEKTAAQRRHVAADQLLIAVKSTNTSLGKAQPDEESQRAIRRILSLYARFAYFDAGSNAKPKFSSASHDIFQARLSSSLTYLTANATDPFIHAYSLVPIINKFESIPNDAKLLLEAEDSVQEVLDQTTDTMQSLFLRIDNTRPATRGSTNLLCF